MKLIAFDLDGTLLGADGRVPEGNARALRECERRGIRLMFCSGRAFEVQAGIAREAGIDPIIASANGARIDAGTQGPTLREETIDPALSRHLFRALMDAGLYFMAFTRGHTYMFNTDMQKSLKKHHHAPGMYEYAGLNYEVVGDEGRAGAECLGGVYKFICFSRDNDPMFDEIKGALAGLDLYVSSSWADNVEMMRSGVDKGAALRFIMDMYGIAPDEVMAFGDNDNDLPMLANVGWPVAMGNAINSVKAQARIIASNCEDCGVGAVLNERVLSER